ncbi:hypothetical protein IFN73_09845, partial [Francisella tularensis subsp. holarctica]|nr:hypothetical protein [Francisella tularensis subsp. holarctica]
MLIVSHNYKVAVLVGGGIAGLSLALSLYYTGYMVALVESNDMYLTLL